MTLELDGPNTVAWRMADAPMTGTVYYGRDEAGVGAVQVAVVTVASRPTKGSLTAMWKTRGANTPMPVVVAAIAPDGVWLHGPDPAESPVGPISVAQAQRQLQAVLDEPHGVAAQARLRTIRDAHGSIASDGFANHFLFATYYLKNDVRRRPDWAASGERAAGLLTTRGRALIDALGFSVEDAPAGAFVLRATSGSRRAVAVLLDESEDFDRTSAKYQLSPVAHGLEIAGREDVPWVIVMRKDTLRLYPGRDGVGVGQRGQSQTYFELRLADLDPDLAALLPLIFSAEALEKGGSADEILAGSGRYAAELGAHLRDRVYEGVVPGLATAIARRLPELGLAIDADGLRVAYGLTMRILFRLLFQAYGEATELLPAGRNDHYDANSLQVFVTRELTTPPGDFAEDAASIWLDLRQVWDAIAKGNPRWEVPPYGGGLFDPESEEGRLLQRLELPDAVMGPALQAMLTEFTDDGVRGSVDFRSLQVRDFGTIYEGLLESSLSIADGDLAVDARGAFVPAKKGDEIAVVMGEPYFHSASGERKATGSYYTPKLVVDHLVQRSVEPALERHLAGIRELLDAGREREAADRFFDFRVADLAMGSGHFLVAAVDKIERGMRDFLTAHPVPGVRAELQRLAATARAQLGDDVEATEAITEAQLLRRQIARRCIYGLDVNPLAVELSRLALWIHTFVPGLPMSSLDHGLVLANSLTGVGTVDEAIDALAVGDLLAPLIREPLDAARELLIDYANASEADKAEVTQGAEMLAEAIAAAAPAKVIFDVAVAMRLGVVKPGSAFTRDDIDELAADPAVRAAVDPLAPAHMPYLFPEVFLRENPGFDVLIGNPPWEKLHVEEHQWWGLRIPRLRSMPAAARAAALENFRAERPDLEREYELAIESTAAINRAVGAGPYPGVGAAHLDLYQAFAWRFWSLCRGRGRCALVLPRGALSGSALAAWRREVFAGGSFADVCFLTNNQQWVFNNIHPQYTVGLAVLERGDEHVARFAGPFFSATEFAAGSRELAEVDAEEFQSWSSTAAFPLIPDAASAEIFEQMKRSPRLDQARPDWEFRPIQGDLNATSDKGRFVFDVDEARDRIPVLAGASFNLWDPDYGAPYAYADPSTLRDFLRTRLERAVTNSRSAYFELDFGFGELPMDRARIAFRDVARATDTRTVIAALLPPGSVSVHNAPLLVARVGGASAEAFTLGVLCSLPFDWAARRWVELHLTFEILAALPMPAFKPDESLSRRVVEIAGRLAAVDGRYREWAAEIGVEVGTAKADPEKSDLIHELDALVALLYGLSRDQVEHLFATFHRGCDYGPRLSATLAHYDGWEER